MKKFFLSVALAAMTAFAFTACTGAGENAEQGAETDSAAVEQQAPETPPAEVKIEDQTELECDQYLIKIPEGWRAGSRVVNSTCNLRVRKPPFTTAAAMVPSLDYDAYKADKLKDGGKTLDPVIVGDKTWELVSKDDRNGEPQIFAMTTSDDKAVAISFTNGAHKMEDAEARQALLDNAKAVIAATTVK